MLGLKYVEMRNFGPYYGQQRLEIPSSDGVTIIVGENGRGKTTLLNAIRYGLFGRVTGRGGRAIDLSHFPNEVAVSEGDYSYAVEVGFGFDKDSYVLVRGSERKRTSTSPFGPLDYQQFLLLMKNGDVLSHSDAVEELGKVLPESVSRFFLFDGELLQQYEDLVGVVTPESAVIKDSIERILGVPVLINARYDCAEAARQARTRVAAGAKRNARTSDLGTTLQILNENLNLFKAEELDKQKQLSSLVEQERSISETLEESQDTARWLAEKDSITAKVTQAKADLDAAAAQRLEESRSAWLLLLRRELEVSLKRSDELIQHKVDLDMSTSRREALSRALDQGTCPVCHAQIDDTVRQILDDEISGLSREIADLAGRESGDAMSQRALVLSLLSQISASSLRLAERTENQARVDLADLETKLHEADSHLSSEKAEDTRTLLRRLTAATQKKTLVTEALTGIRSKIDQDSRFAAEISGKISGLAGSDQDMVRSSRLEKLSEDLRCIFDAAVDAYREKLKGQVQSDATMFFRRLSEEPEFTDLRINENYGLLIVRSNGSEVVERSAGFEHVVALALTAALHRNAPLRGPVIMDSPFMRLDGAHRNRVLTALPSMSDQVILLVYSQEIVDWPQARRALGSSLLAEYHLERVSSQYTKIAKGVPGNG